jgi:AraC-like DNA-binding protein
MHAQLLSILSTIVLFQFVLLSFFLFTVKKGRRLSNFLLGSFLLLLAINIADGLLTYHKFFLRFPELALIEDCLILLYGPLIFIYTRSVIYKDFSLTIGLWLHSVPFILLALASIVGYHLQSTDLQQQIQNAITQHELPNEFYVAVAGIYIHLFWYLFLAWREVRRYRMGLKDLVSSIHEINLEWLAFMIYSFAFLLMLSLANRMITLTSWRNYFDAMMVAVFVFLFFFVNAIVIRGLRHPEIFAGIDETSPSQKYKGSTLTALEKDDMRVRLISIMENERLFLNPDITLEDLAIKLSVSSKKLSQLLNETFQQNYFDFINSYRIEEAKKIMTESTDSKLTVLEVLYQAGFNSKSSFNTLFKNKVGLTPSEFKKTVQKRS